MNNFIGLLITLCFAATALFVVVTFMYIVTDGPPSAEEMGERLRSITTAPRRFWQAFRGPQKETKQPKPRSAVE